MIFNTVQFILFFVVVTLLYYVIPHKGRWVCLLIANYYFYMSWNTIYVLLMTTSILVTYLCALCINGADNLADKGKRLKRRKFWLAFCFIANLGILVFYKYFYFILDNINSLLSYIGKDALNPAINILLPIGISFYTFQALSYATDVYRGEISAEKNLIQFTLYVSFFPPLVAGPIERSKNLLTQMYERHYFDLDRVKNGILLMLWGLFQKIAIADRAAVVVNEIYDNYHDYSGAHIIFATVLFAFQIYCDFSAYSDIARGSAQVLGFRLVENFKCPYFSLSIKEFWHRWHISLSTWFRDYLYIPLGGSRPSVYHKYRNLMITFIVSGLWHGANWHFVIWGGLHGAYRVAGEAIEPLRRKLLSFFNVDNTVFSYKLLRGIITFILVDIAWIFFRAPDAATAFRLIEQIFTNLDPFALIDYVLVKKLSMLFLFCSILLFIMIQIAQVKLDDIWRWIETQNLWFRWLLYYTFIFGVLFVAISFANDNSQIFIYFQF